MSTVTDTRTLVVVGARPRRSALDALGDVPFGGEAMLVVLGLHPTPDQQRLTEDALTLAAERRFVLTAEMVGNREQLHDRVRQGVGGPSRRVAWRTPPVEPRGCESDHGSRREMTWMSRFEAARISRVTNDPCVSSFQRDRRDSPTTICVTECR